MDECTGKIHTCPTRTGRKKARLLPPTDNHASVGSNPSPMLFDPPAD